MLCERKGLWIMSVFEDIAVEGLAGPDHPSVEPSGAEGGRRVGDVQESVFGDQLAEGADELFVDVQLRVGRLGAGVGQGEVGHQPREPQPRRIGNRGEHLRCQWGGGAAAGHAGVTVQVQWDDDAEAV